MADYCSVSDVKAVLHFEADVTSEDAELTADVATGSGLVDGFLKPKGLTAPPVVPQLIKDAAANFAAWAYRRDRDAVSATAFWNSAVAFLQTYMDAEVEPYVGSA